MIWLWDVEFCGAFRFYDREKLFNLFLSAKSQILKTKYQITKERTKIITRMTSNSVNWNISFNFNSITSSTSSSYNKRRNSESQIFIESEISNFDSLKRMTLIYILLQNSNFWKLNCNLLHYINSWCCNR